MSPHLPAKFGKIALAVFGLGIAALAVGATEPTYPVLGRADQGLDSGTCPPATVDGVRVCLPRLEAAAGVSVITVAPGLSIVQ